MPETSPLIPANTFNENLSSYQIASILDQLLFEALRPLAEQTRVLAHWLAEMLPLIVSDGRRRVSNVETSELISLAYAAIMTTDPARQLGLIQQMKLERNQIFFLITRIQEVSGSYCDDQLVVLQTSSRKKKLKYQARLHQVEKALQTNSKHWHQAYLTCTYWCDLAFEFKRIIAEKYYKYAFKKAVEAGYTTGLDISIADLYNNYILAIYRAIDKYNSSRGMLSSYIKLWFKNASSNPDFDHEVNVAFTIPASQRRILQKSNWTSRSGVAIMNLANPIDEQAIDENLIVPEQSELVDQLGQIGRNLKLNTFMVLANIPYKLSTTECKMLTRINQLEQSKLTIRE